MEGSGEKKYVCNQAPRQEGLFYKRADVNFDSVLTINEQAQTIVLSHSVFIFSEVSQNECFSERYEGKLKGKIVRREGKEIEAELEGEYRIHRDQFGYYDNFSSQLKGKVIIEVEGNKLKIKQIHLKNENGEDQIIYGFTPNLIYT